MVDERQATSVPRVFAAGEITGWAVWRSPWSRARSPVPLRPVSRALIRRSSGAGTRCGPSRGEWSALLRSVRSSARSPVDDTIICRCEDVQACAARALADSRQAKLYARAGMGACQGRVCGPALELLFGWQPGTVRSPLEPARLLPCPPRRSRGAASSDAVLPQDRDHATARLGRRLPRDHDAVHCRISPVDHAFLREHVSWLVDEGCTGIVALGSLGESATLSFDEKVAILESCAAPSAIAFRSSPASPA